MVFNLDFCHKQPNLISNLDHMFDPILDVIKISKTLFRPQTGPHFENLTTEFQVVKHPTKGSTIKSKQSACDKKVLQISKTSSISFCFTSTFKLDC